MYVSDASYRYDASYMYDTSYMYSDCETFSLICLRIYMPYTLP